MQMSDKNSTKKINPVWIRAVCGENSSFPKYQTEASVGCDLHSAVDLVIKPGKRALVGTGIKLETPNGVGAMVCSRSGLAIKHGIAVLNSPGIIDSDFRGEIRVILHNSGDEDFHVSKGDRIAQLVFFPIVQAIFQDCRELSQTDRGEGGFGSTGVTSA